MKKTFVSILILSIVLCIFCTNYAFAENSSEIPRFTIDDNILKNPIVEKNISGPIVLDDFVFKGLMANQNFTKSKNIIKSILGEPLKVEDRDWSDSIERTYFYPGFIIKTFLEDNYEIVVFIIITDSGPKTVRGITVGDSVEKLFQSYGETFSLPSKDYITYFYSLILYDSLSYYHLNFDVENGKIIRISYTYEWAYELMGSKNKK